MAVKEPTGDLKKACWKGYTAVGMKNKNGRKVPNCVPANEARSDDPDYDKSQARFKKGLPPSKKKPPYKEDSYWAKRKKQGTMEGLDEMDNRTPSGDRREQRANSPEAKAQREKEQHVGYIDDKGKLVTIGHKPGFAKSVGHADGGWIGTGRAIPDSWKAVYAKMREEVEQMNESKPFHIVAKDHNGNELHIRRSSGKQTIHSHNQTNQPIHLSSVVTSGIKGSAGRAIDVQNTLHQAQDSTHAAELMNRSGLGYKNWRAMNEETAGVQKHIVAVTLSDPSVKSSDKIFKKIAVRASDKDEAKKRAIKFYRKAGYKVHDAYHHSVVTVLNKEEVKQMDEKGDFWHPNPKFDSKMGGRSAAIVQQKTPSKQKDDAHLALLKRLAAAGKKIAAEEVEQMDEKRLTPAERKKREEIAQAMERKNPGMDMGKKMAIATAQAKKVAEGYGPKRYGSREHDWGDGPEPNSDKKFPYSGQNKSSWAHVHVNGEKVKEFHGPTSYDDASEHAHELAYQHKKAGQKHKIEIRDHSQPNTMIRVNETRNIIREVIKKKVDDQGTNQAKGKTATGEPMPKVQIDPVIDLGPTRG
jgi:hypothetical protein